MRHAACGSVAIDQEPIKMSKMFSPFELVKSCLTMAVCPCLSSCSCGIPENLSKAHRQHLQTMMSKGQATNGPGHVRLEEFPDEEGAQRRQDPSHDESLQNDAKTQENKAIAEEQLPWTVRTFNRYGSYLQDLTMDPRFL